VVEQEAFHQRRRSTSYTIRQLARTLPDTIVSHETDSLSRRPALGPGFSFAAEGSVSNDGGSDLLGDGHAKWFRAPTAV
jgi:hypothetical protein